MKVSLPLIKNIITPLAKTVLVMAAFLATDGATSKKKKKKKGHKSNINKTITSNKEIKNIIKKFKSLKEWDLLIESFS